MNWFGFLDEATNQVSFSFLREATRTVWNILKY
jgi:hypothetical protein